MGGVAGMKLLIDSTELCPYFMVMPEQEFGCWSDRQVEIPAAKYRKWKKAMVEFHKVQHEMSSYYNKSNEQTPV